VDALKIGVVTAVLFKYRLLGESPEGHEGTKNVSLRFPRARGNQMTTAKLNRFNVAVVTPDAECMLWDTELKGFGYLQRRAASGEILRSYLIQYRCNGQQRKLKLGDAAKINADQARKKAEKLFAQILLGTDPQAVKEAERAEAARVTFAEAVEKYLEAKKAEVRPSSLKLAELYLTGTRYFPFRKHWTM
jgi:hypothetical protein